MACEIVCKVQVVHGATCMPCHHRTTMPRANPHHVTPYATCHLPRASPQEEGAGVATEPAAGPGAAGTGPDVQVQVRQKTAPHAMPGRCGNMLPVGGAYCQNYAFAPKGPLL